MMVSRRYEPNMRQLFRHYPEIGAAVVEHDEGVKSLMCACSDAMEQLLRSPEFTRRFAQLPSVVPNGFGTGVVEQRAIAAAIINGVRLEDNHFLAPLWNLRADELLALRREPESEARVRGGRDRADGAAHARPDALRDDQRAPRPAGRSVRPGPRRPRRRGS